MERIRSYPSIYNVGHKAIADIFTSPVIVQEKVDGSQFSFTLKDGVLGFRSKGQEVFEGAPDKMFAPAVQAIVAVKDQLHDGWVYRGECLTKPKHNSLRYSRTPASYVILFDIDMGMEEYAVPALVRAEASRLGLETVPTLYEGIVASWEFLKGFLECESVLGGANIEGIVVKNYALFTSEKKVMMAKYVSEAFKEVHSREWKRSNPGRSDVIEDIIARYKTEARWRKAIQHLRESGAIEDSPRDIGPLLRAINEDVLKEEEEAIKALLFKRFWGDISRGLTRGFPEWYKNQLAAAAFETEVPA